MTHPIGCLVVDNLTKNYCRVVEFDEATGRLHLKNPHIHIGWRNAHDVSEPVEETQRKKNGEGER